MGFTYTDITLANAGDITDVQRGHRKEQDVRKIAVRALADTGAGTLIINDAVCQQLGLTIEGLRGATVAGGGKSICKVTEPVRIYWNNRDTACKALVMPGEPAVLLGAIPLEDMDLVVNPAKQLVEGAHGDEVICMVK
jgi:clan AA aspartic protease